MGKFAFIETKRDYVCYIALFLIVRYTLYTRDFDLLFSFLKDGEGRRNANAKLNEILFYLVSSTRGCYCTEYRVNDCMKRYKMIPLGYGGLANIVSITTT